MTYLDQYYIAVTPDFQKKIEIAICRAAISVQAEDETSLAVPVGSTLTQQQLHDKRSALAYNILNNPSTYAKIFAMTVASDPNDAGIGLASTDNDLLFTVNAIFSAFAVDGLGGV